MLHPTLEAKIKQLLSALTILGFPMKIVQGVRTAQEQQKLFAQGRTAPGKIVTNCDGVLKKSRHQLAADGYGHAIDCAFIVLGEAGKVTVSWAESHPWKLYGEVGKALGLVWGGDWKGLVDRPHLELP